MFFLTYIQIMSVWIKSLNILIEFAFILLQVGFYRKQNLRQNLECRVYIERCPWNQNFLWKTKEGNWRENFTHDAGSVTVSNNPVVGSIFFCISYSGNAITWKPLFLTLPHSHALHPSTPNTVTKSWRFINLLNFFILTSPPCSSHHLDSAFFTYLFNSCRNFLIKFLTSNLNSLITTSSPTHFTARDRCSYSSPSHNTLVPPSFQRYTFTAFRCLFSASKCRLFEGDTHVPLVETHN